MIWPFQRRATDATATDQRLSDLDDRLSNAARVIKANEPRAARAKSRAEKAAERRAAAIKANHFDQLFTRELRESP